MSYRTFLTRRRVTLLAGVAGLLLMTAPAPAVPKRTAQDGLVAQLVCEILKRGHLAQPKLGEDVSRRLFLRFLKDLDANKVYFTKDDIDEFNKQETKLTGMLAEGDLSFPSLVYERLVKRVEERQKL